MLAWFHGAGALLRLEGAILLLAFASTVGAGEPPLMAGWGVDACISCFAPTTDVDGYIARLRDAGIRYVRERQPGDPGDPDALGKRPFRDFRRLREAGLDVVAFDMLPRSLVPRDRNSQLPEDLLAVYRASAEMSRLFGSAVSVWEMQNEPDLHFCEDLPDRLTSYQKAMYLGIKDGAPAPCGVLMGALGYAPSPWLRRAAANGLYDYTDGLNFHYYGHAGDLRGYIVAQRDFARRYVRDRSLPMWLTECGIDAVPADDLDEPLGREIQRAFVDRTARIARELGVAVFMPFLFVGAPDLKGYRLMRSPSQPHPAWTGYADYIQSHRLFRRLALAVPPQPSRVVLQWLPDPRTCIPHKVSGAYWFRGGPKNAIRMKGEIVAYNFSNRRVEGRLRVRVPQHVSAALPGSASREITVTIGPFSAVRLPVEFDVNRTTYVRGEVAVRLFGAARQDASLVFGLASAPRPGLLRDVRPVALRPPARDLQWIWSPQSFEITSRVGPWVGVNGVRVAPPDAAAPTAWRFDVPKPSPNPRRPPMAIAAVDGLPSLRHAFLRMRLLADSLLDFDVRVDLVDDSGQRFTIAENFGRNRLRPDLETTYLSYADFHLYQWGRCTSLPFFDPRRVRELQLRFFPPAGGGRLGVQLDVVAPKSRQASQ